MAANNGSHHETKDTEANVRDPDQRLVIDETILTPAECRDALNDSFREPISAERRSVWSKYILPGDIVANDETFQRLKDSGYYTDVQTYEVEKGFAIHLLGVLRHYAFCKYGGVHVRSG